MIRQNSYHQADRSASDELHPVHQNRSQQRQLSATESEWTPSKNGAVADQLPENVDPPSKRRRVALACTVCRGRKSRCDGARPKCSLCIELGFECVYQQSSSYSNIIVGKEYLSSIEDRLKIVEDRLSSLENGDQPIPSQPIQAISLPAPALVTNGASRDTAQPETASVRDDSVDDAETTEDPIDAMGAVTFAEEEESAFFGPSSNIAFLRNISRAVARLTNDSQPWKPSPVERNSVGYTGGFINASRPVSPAPTHHDQAHDKVNIYALPSDSVARQLLAWYFSNTGVLFPYLHEQSFMSTFEQVSKDKFKGVRRTWLALLNIVFAHAAVHARDATTTPASMDSTGAFKADAESEMYFKRALGLFNEKAASGAGSSVEGVILLLLLGQYLQGTQKSVQTWKMHGVAVRAALQIGLHSSDLANSFPPIEREIRKRTWFGCVMLDRTLSMTFGRPASIPDSYVQMDLPVEFSTLTTGVAGTDMKESLAVAFFNGSATLYKVLCTTIDSLYGQNLACSFQANAVDTVALVYKIENQLSEWQRGLPSHMRLIVPQDMPERLPPAETSTDEAWRPIRLRFILTLRYTNVRILLHRPVLVKFLEGLSSPGDTNDFSLLQQMGAIHIQIATKSAKEIISLVLNALQSATGRSKWGLLGAWWFTLYYTFNAALVLGACVLVHVDQKALAGEAGLPLPDPTDDMISHLDMAIEALRHLDSDNRMAERCRDYLEQFVQVVRTLAIAQGLLPEPNDWQGPYRHPVHNAHATSQPHPHASVYPQSGDYALLHSTAINMFNNTSVIPGGSTKHSPMGMEMGEFMLDGDLEFLTNHSYAYGRAVAPPDYK